MGVFLVGEIWMAVQQGLTDLKAATSGSKVQGIFALSRLEFVSLQWETLENRQHARGVCLKLCLESLWSFEGCAVKTRQDVRHRLRGCGCGG